MEARDIEPRRVMWAVAEVSWADSAGAPCQARATLEDMSPSGACLRLKAPIQVGARLRVKWHREQFSAVARNCRKDGAEYLLGVRRETESLEDPPSPTVPRKMAGRDAAPREQMPKPAGKFGTSAHESAVANTPAGAVQRTAMSRPPYSTVRQKRDAGRGDPAGGATYLSRPDARTPADLARSIRLQSAGPPARPEREVMQPKRLFPQFWRRQHDPKAPEQVPPTEAPVNKVDDSAAEAASGPRNELLSYDDIYHAAGIMSPRTGYGIHKVIEMLNSERIRELSKDIKRASILMALDAAGASVDELLQDANRRQHALNSYEDGQRKQLEEFETRKAQENARIQAEMERVATHYAERIQHNRDQVAHEKEALHNWQMAKQHEVQRISEVIEVCSKPPAPQGMGAAAGQAADAGREMRPTLVGEVPKRG